MGELSYDTMTGISGSLALKHHKSALLGGENPHRTAPAAAYDTSSSLPPTCFLLPRPQTPEFHLDYTTPELSTDPLAENFEIMSYIVMPEDLLPGGDSLEPSPPREGWKSPKPAKGYPPIALPPQVVPAPYIPSAPRDIPVLNTPMPSRKKGKKWLALPLADPDRTAVRDYHEVPYSAEQPKEREKKEDEKSASGGPRTGGQALEPSIRKNMNSRRVSAPVTIRNPADMSEVELAKIVRPSMAKRYSTLKTKKAEETKARQMEGKKKAKNASQSPIAPLLEGTVPDEEYFTTLPLALDRAWGLREAREKAVNGTGVEGSDGNCFSGDSSVWGAHVSTSAVPPTIRKNDNYITEQELFFYNQNAMPISNGYDSIRGPQGEPVDGRMLAAYLEDRRGRHADPANPIQSITHRLTVLEDAFRKLISSTNVDTQLREDLQNVTRDFQNKALAEMTLLGANLQTLQNTVASIIRRQDTVESAIVSRMQKFEEELLEDMAVSGRILGQFRELKNDTNDRLGELRQLRDDVDTLKAESVQCRFRTEHLWNNRVYRGNVQNDGATDKSG
ncbi:unnamed protein product [Tuber aestivum]|uniref:Uncharacterized protein n=1 Tax=Tuber aestivum TaxID=59557 RepID=A0A292Q041_9PEZI|nr:unnamed protein product [Tuber aestivum]